MSRGYVPVVSELMIASLVISAVYRYVSYTVPQQLAQLVRQAHAMQPFQTRWRIEASDDMRDALRSPLTPPQLRALEQAEHDISSRNVSCYVLSHRRR